METTNQNGETLNVHFNLDTWMKDLESVISNTTLYDLVIPGTHDSGTYGILEPPVQKPDFTQVLHLKKNIETLIKLIEYKSGRTQNKTIQEQLLLGARFLDLRIKRFNREKGYKLHHSSTKTTISLDEALNDIKNFIDKKEHSKEIIIVGITPGNTGNSDLTKILDTFKTKFANRIASKNFAKAHCIKDFWGEEKQIVLFWNWNSKSTNYPRKKEKGKLKIDDEFIWTYNDVKEAYAGQKSTPGTFIGLLSSEIDSWENEKYTKKLNIPFIIQGVVPAPLVNKEPETWKNMMKYLDNDDEINIYKMIKTVHPDFKDLVKDIWNRGKESLLNIIIIDFIDECPDFIKLLIHYNIQKHAVLSEEVEELSMH